MFPRAFRIARVRGIDVRVDPTWILIALLVVWTFYSRFSVSERQLATNLVMATVGALLFFASVLIHELAHALEAQHRGIEVRGITLFLFGGVTEMHLETERPFDEFAISAVGPYSSLVLAAAFGIVATFAGAFGAPLVAEVAGMLGWLNVLLAIFNLIPGAPLDGGRVLRSIVWAVGGSRARAIRWASYAGQGVAVLLWLAAVRAVLASPEGGLFDGLWWAFIGWFLWQAAISERKHAQTEELLGDRTVGDLSRVLPPRLLADRPLSLVVDQIAASPGFEVYPVVTEDEDGPIVGALHLPDVLEMDPTDRNFRTAGEAMRPIEAIPAIGQDEPVTVLLRRLSEDELLKVVDDEGRITSLITARQTSAALERLRALQER